MALFVRVLSPSSSCAQRGDGLRLPHGCRSWKCRAEPERSSSNDDEDDRDSTPSSSQQSILERLERLTQSSSGVSSSNTIASKLVKFHGSRDEEGSSDFTVPLVFSRTKKPKISVRRNIKRQEYLDKVAQRDDSRTFATIGMFVLLPPLAILGAAIAAGYVNILP